MSRQIDNYWNRYETGVHYDALLMRDGYGMQASEINEIQSILEAKRRKLAAALFKDGDIIRGAQIVVDPVTGETRATAGEIFLDGQIWDLEQATLTIPTAGNVFVGVRLTEQVISELEDPGLLNPAIGHAAEGQPGAWRRKMAAAWGYDGDGGEGEFFPVYSITDGVPASKEAPPTLDSYNQALARYDRDSTGTGTYAVNGLTVTAAEDLPDGRQSYCVAEGRARVNGLGVDIATSRRIYYDARPDLREIAMEVAEAAAADRQRVEVAHPPLKSVTGLRITVQEKYDIVHGSYQGCSDPLPVTGILKIVSVRQMDTEFAEGSDFARKGDQLDWTLPGSEPANGSTYEVVLQRLKDVEPEAPDLDGFSVSGCVPGSQIIFSYAQMLPRYDRLAMDSEGQMTWFKGIASETNPLQPVIPDSLLGLATVYQDWRPGRQVQFDADMVIPFSTLARLISRVDRIDQEMARNRLEMDAGTRESGARVGIFVDPLRDDSMRDQGLAQNAAIVDGLLMLPITGVRSLALSETSTGKSIRPWTLATLLEQPLRTGDMPVNPYMAFDPFPAQVVLEPAIDQWTETETNWTSAITRRVRLGRTRYTWGWRTTSTTTSTETVSSTTTALEYLRQIEVKFTVSGFGPGEKLKSAVFDGLDIMDQIGAKTADARGELSGSFTIPARVPAGSKLVRFTGQGGSRGTATFVGQGNLTVQTLRNVTTNYGDFYEPVAQTFAFERAVWLAAVELWLTAKQTEVRVELREVQNGMPTGNVLAVSRVQPAAISTVGATRFAFDEPILLAANTEYAFVVMCNDAVTRVAIAEMGKYDKTSQRWVSAQPYTVGVLLSSSNASTWTAHQDADLAFRLLEAVFDGDTPHTVELGAVHVENATDILLLALADIPTAQCGCDYSLTLPTGQRLTVDAGQPVPLQEPITGDIAVAATLSGQRDQSAILYPGAQVIAGKVECQANYFTRSIGARGAAKVSLIYEARIPAGASVTPLVQVDSGEWQNMTAAGATPGDDGVVEFRFTHSLENAQLVKARLELAGTVTARPEVANIRLLAVA